MKVAINRKFGGFSLSKAAVLRLRELGVKAALEAWTSPEEVPGDAPSRDMALTLLRFSDMFHLDVPRTDERLIAVIAELGERANGACAQLEIVEVPDDVKWHIEEYDGWEHIAEDHRTWP